MSLGYAKSAHSDELGVDLRRPGRVRRPDACAALILKLDVLGSYTLHSEAA